MSRGILTLSHLYPSSEYPSLGPFVRDEVTELAKRHTVAVVSPLPRRIHVPLVTTRKEPLPRMWSTEGDVEVVRPRLPAVPLGGLFVESRLWASRLAPLLCDVYRRISGELIHAHFAMPDGFAAARYASRARVPFVLTIRGSDVMVFGSRRSLRGTLKETFDGARAVIAVSDELANRAEQLGAESERIHVIPGGVPFGASIARDEARERLRVAGDVVCVLWIGGLVPVKQPLHAIEAFEHLVRSGMSEPLLVMIGDGPLRHEVRAFIGNRGLDHRVRLVGGCSRERVWTWQCAADALINSSRSEGTPISVLEALGAGTPVVGYPVGGVGAAVVAVGGGRVTKERTPQALANAVAEELGRNRNRERLARDARARFDIAVTGRALEMIYEAVV
jgi:teichuronic acid biosynthesis glycosyltransferase TuaC